MNSIQISSYALAGLLAGWLSTATPALACAGAAAGGPAFNANLAAARAHATLPTVLKAKPEVAPRDLNPPSISGLWLKTYTVDGQLIDQGFDTFTADGNEMIVDISPPVTDNVCTGVWSQTDTFTYSLYHISWNFDMNGNLLGTAVFTESLTLSRDGNSFTGSSTLNLYDNDGNLLQAVGTAQVTATRIKPI